MLATLGWMATIMSLGLILYSILVFFAFSKPKSKMEKKMRSDSPVWCFTGVLMLSLLGIGYCTFGGDTEKKSKPPRQIDVIDESHNLCRVLRGTGLVISCDTNINFGRKNSIDVVIDTNSGEAREMCLGMQRQIPSSTKFDGEWELRIISPYSGGTPIATCTLY